MARVPEQWLSLVCRFCQSRLRIKAKFGHLRGRCPECGRRLEAPRPVTRSATVAEGDLMPVDEEWPEPAQLEEEDPRANYGLNTAPPVWNDAASSPIPRHEPEATPYSVDEPDAVAPVSAPVLYRLSQAETAPQRPPPPPRFPLWQGIYLFPWRNGEYFVLWLYLAMGLTLVELLICGIKIVFSSLQGNPPLAVFLILLVALLSIVTLLCGAHLAALFLAVLEGTAAGNDKIQRPDFVITEAMGKFLYLVWLLSLSLLPAALSGGLVLALPRIDRSWMLLSLLVVPLLFPIVLLTSLSANSAWTVWDVKFLRRLLRKPQAVFVMVVPPLMLFVVAGLLVYWSVVQVQVYLTIVAGLVGSASVLIYGRLLGRVAWFVTLGAKAKGK